MDSGLSRLAGVTKGVEIFEGIDLACVLFVKARAAVEVVLLMIAEELGKSGEEGARSRPCFSQVSRRA